MLSMRTKRLELIAATLAHLEADLESTGHLARLLGAEPGSVRYERPRP